MSTKVDTGNNLPLIFVKGQPASLHDMTLIELRNFLPFLVQCESKGKCELPHSRENNKYTPPWWPTKVPFSWTVLYEKLPSKELIQKLTKIVSCCYAYHSSSYLIGFSASLARESRKKNAGSGKLTFVPLDNGTTRILNGRNNVVAVIRSSVREYDKEDMNNRQRLKRRSSRLTTVTTTTTSNKEEVENLATHFVSPFISLEKMNTTASSSASSAKRRRKNLERACRSKPDILKVAEDITNQIRSKNNHVLTTTHKHEERQELESESKFGEILTPKNRSRRRTISDKVKGEIPCEKCGKLFSHLDYLEEHESIQCGTPEQSDVRDDAMNKQLFLRMIGLRDPTEAQPISNSASNATQIEVPINPPVRSLRKVFARSKLGAAIKAHPLPITCKRGQELLTRHGERINCGNVNSVTFEKNCSSLVTRVPLGPSPNISTQKKHRIKENQYVHSYSFSKQERKMRDVELIVGLSTRSFELYNRCRNVKIRVERLQHSVVESIIQRDKRRIEERQRRLASIVKRCTPRIVLTDIIKEPDTLPLKLRHYVSKLI